MSFPTNNTTVHGDRSVLSTPCYVNDPFRVKLGRIVAYSVLILASLVGNILIITVIRKYGKARKTINYTVVNMAVASLVITTSYMPRLIPMFLFGTAWLVNGAMGYVLCKIVPFLHGVAILASVLNLLASSLDTFCALVFPMRNFFTAKAAKFAIFLTWFLAILGRLPYLIALRTKISKGRQICSSSLNNAFNSTNSREIYYTFLLVTFYAIPWLAIFGFYSAIVVILKTGKTPRQESVTAVRVTKARERATRNVIKMMLIITLVFLICWITYFLAQLAFNRVPCSVRFWRLFLVHCNCAINPVLFAVFNTTARRGIKDIVRKWRRFRVCLGFLRNVSQGRVFKRNKIYISPKRPTSFSINASMKMSDFSEIRRKRVSRKNAGEAELGIVNEEVSQKNIFTAAILSFKTLY